MDRTPAVALADSGQSGGIRSSDTAALCAKARGAAVPERRVRSEAVPSAPPELAATYLERFVPPAVRLAQKQSL
jgi:hypothetical protein